VKGGLRIGISCMLRVLFRPNAIKSAQTLSFPSLLWRAVYEETRMRLEGCEQMIQGFIRKVAWPCDVGHLLSSASLRRRHGGQRERWLPLKACTRWAVSQASRPAAPFPEQAPALQLFA